MSNSIRAAGVCLLAVGVMIAGCGDDDGSAIGGPTTDAGANGGQTGSAASASAGKLEPTSESKEEYVAKANALCKKRRQRLQADLKKAFEEAQDAEGSEQQQALRGLVVDLVAPGMEAETDELRELGAPEEDAARVEAIVAAIEAVAAEAREDPRAFATDSSALAEVQRLARRYGIAECGRAS